MPLTSTFRAIADPPAIESASVAQRPVWDWAAAGQRKKDQLLLQIPMFVVQSVCLHPAR